MKRGFRKDSSTQNRRVRDEDFDQDLIVDKDENTTQTHHVEALNAILAFLKANNRLDTFSFFFYQYIHRHSPDLHKLFESAVDKLAVKFGKLFMQLIGTAGMDENGLGLLLAALSLKHLQYGVTSEHVDPFGTCLVTCVKTFCKKQGFFWNHDHSVAWKWLWRRVSKSFKMNLNTVGPHVSNINSSWRRLLHMASLGLAADVKKGDKNFTKDTIDAQLSQHKANNSKSKNHSQQNSKSIKVHSQTKASLRKSRLKKQARERDKASFTLETLQINSRTNDKENLPELAWIGNNFFTELKKALKGHSLNITWPAQSWMALQMGIALDLIVTLTTNSSMMALQMRTLGIRHITMGLTKEALDDFGWCLMRFMVTPVFS